MALSGKAAAHVPSAAAELQRAVSEHHFLHYCFSGENIVTFPLSLVL